jgi:hypothetical protein
MQQERAAMLHRLIDLLGKRALERSPNWLRREAILNTAQVIVSTDEAGDGPRRCHTPRDIANAARLIQTFMHGMTKEAFLGDLKTQPAVLHQVTVIGGEAVKRPPQAFRERHPIRP